MQQSPRYKLQEMKYKDCVRVQRIQVANSPKLIERLRSQLAQTDKADEIDAAVDEQNLRI